MEEKRQHPRVSSQLPIALEILDAKTAKELKLKMTASLGKNANHWLSSNLQAVGADLSLGGMGILGDLQKEFSKLFYQSQTVLMEIPIPDGEAPFQALGAAVWAKIQEDGICRMGFDFQVVSSANKQRMRRYVSQGIVRATRENFLLPVQAGVSQKKILVVDDFENGRSSCVEMLSTLGVVRENITEASSGEEALGFMQRHHFDLVLSDVAMPNMPGDVMVRRMGEDARLAHIPVILHTGYLGQNLEGIETYSNVTAVFKKPYSALSFMDTIEKALAESPAA